ncbi:MAG: hypothetical protein R3C53_28780 [Pirellulaceae bacterium]
MMIEILDNLDVLTQPVLDLSKLSLDGVHFGSGVAHFPRQKITELTFAKIVQSSRSGTNIEPEYRDADDCLLALDEVIDSVFRDDGIAHFSSKLSFKIAAGKIVGFAIYGDQLRYFSDIKSLDECLQRFGKPDRVQKKEAYGDVMGFDIYYFASRKLVSWDSWDDRVSLINLGSYNGNDGQPDKAG